MSAKNKSWYSIENAATDEATIYVYDEISRWGVDAKQFVKDLNGVTAKTINLKINSPGGNVFDGCTIHNALKDHAATVNVQVDGLAASIASIIAMAGDKITMAKSAMMMIHNAWGGCCGNSCDMQKMADVLDKIDGNLVQTYSDRTGMAKRNIKQMMTDETWMTADEAVKNGFADCVGSNGDAKASFDLSNFQNVPPQALANFAMKRDEQPTERDQEQRLRDAGFSKTEAKAAVSVIKAENLRDADGKQLAIARMQVDNMIQILTT